MLFFVTQTLPQPLLTSAQSHDELVDHTNVDNAARLATSCRDHTNFRQYQHLNKRHRYEHCQNIDGKKEERDADTLIVHRNNNVTTSMTKRRDTNKRQPRLSYFSLFPHATAIGNVRSLILHQTKKIEHDRQLPARCFRHPRIDVNCRSNKTKSTSKPHAQATTNHINKPSYGAI